jgi:mRNA interferase MazF
MILKGETLSSTNPLNPRRGEVWDVDFDPTVGSEIQKTRPAVVISSDDMGRLPIRLVAPITGWQDRFKGNIWRVPIQSNAINGLTKDSVVDTMQIRVVAMKRERFITKRGQLNATLMKEIVEAIAAVIEYE